MFETTARRLLAATARAQAEGRVPSLVAGVVADGALAWSAGRGTLPGGADAADVQYRIGSITKTFTAVLVLRLRDEGLLELDTRVGDLLADVPAADRTVGQLLAHVSGLRAETAGPWWERSPGPSWEELVPPVAALGPGAVLSPAGRRFHYSNLGYGLLGAVVEAVRGRAWADCLRAEVLDPLGMARTTPEPVAPAAQGLAVHPWAPAVTAEPSPSYAAMAAAGQLWSTVTDLARWAGFLLGDTGGVLDPATVTEMAEPGAVGDGGAYGLGLQLRRDGGRHLVGHGGSVPGFLAGLVVDPAERTAAVTLANGTAGLGGTLGPALLAVVREAEPRVVDAWAPLEEAELAPLELLGPWYWGPSPLLLAQTDDGLLELRGVDERSRGSRFRATGPDRWVGLDDYHAGEELRVVRDPSGAVAHLDVGTFVFTREPYRGPGTPGGEAAGWTGRPPGQAPGR